MIGSRPYGSEPYGALSTTEDYSALSPWWRFLDDPAAERIWLIDAEPYDPDISDTVSVRAGSAAYVTEPTDTPADTLYPGRAVLPYSFERRLDLRGAAFGARAVPGFGVIELANGDGGMDDWLGYSWDGRAVTVLLGGPDLAYSEFGEVFGGEARTISGSTGRLGVSLRDYAAALDVPIQSETYAGTGGTEGGADLEGKVKPILLGQCRNVQPVYLGLVSGLNTYQVHAGAIEAVDDCYDQGVALTYTAGTPSAGQYTVSTSTGIITLGGTPAGEITADVRGHAAGVYVDEVADLVELVAITYGGLSAGDLDAAAFSDVAARAPYVAGVYCREETNLLDVLDRLAGSVGGYWGFRRDGRFSLEILREPGWAMAEFDGSTISSLERLALEPPAHRVTVGYRRAWYVHGGADLAAGVSAARRAFLTEALRTVAATDSGIESTHLRPSEINVETLLDSATDAAEVRDRLLDLHGAERQLLRVTVRTQPYVLDVGDSVSVTHDRFGLAAGRRMRIVGIEESARSAAAALTLWG